jgi:hypothetical protein
MCVRTYGALIQIGIGHDEMRVLHLVHHSLVHIRDGDLVARCRVCNSLFRTLDGSFLHLMRLCAAAGGIASWCPRCLLLGCRLLVQFLVSALLVLVQVLNELLHGGYGIVARVVATGFSVLRHLDSFFFTVSIRERK